MHLPLVVQREELNLNPHAKVASNQADRLAGASTLANFRCLSMPMARKWLL